MEVADQRIRPGTGFTSNRQSALSHCGCSAQAAQRVHIRYGPLRAMGLEVDASTSMMGKRPGETSGRRPGRWSRPCRAVRLVQTSVLDSGPQALGS